MLKVILIQKVNFLALPLAVKPNLCLVSRDFFQAVLESLISIKKQFGFRQVQGETNAEGKINCATKPNIIDVLKSSHYAFLF